MLVQKKSLILDQLVILSLFYADIELQLEHAINYAHAIVIHAMPTLAVNYISQCSFICIMINIETEKNYHSSQPLTNIVSDMGVC